MLQFFHFHPYWLGRQTTNYILNFHSTDTVSSLWTSIKGMMFSIRTSIISAHCLSWIVFVPRHCCKVASENELNVPILVDCLLYSYVKLLASFGRDRRIQPSIWSTSQHGTFSGRLDRFLSVPDREQKVFKVTNVWQGEVWRYVTKTKRYFCFYSAFITRLSFYEVCLCA